MAYPKALALHTMGLFCIPWACRIRGMVCNIRLGVGQSVQTQPTMYDAESLHIIIFTLGFFSVEKKLLPAFAIYDDGCGMRFRAAACCRHAAAMLLYPCCRRHNVVLVKVFVYQKGNSAHAG